MKSRLYADPSLLVSTLIADGHSGRALEIIGRLKRVVAITDFVELEIRNALELAVFRDPGAVPAAERAIARVDQVVSAGLWHRVEVDFRRCLERARGLSAAHGRVTGCRSLDILHVATAMELGIREFLTIDDRQRRLAIAAGLSVNP